MKKFLESSLYDSSFDKYKSHIKYKNSPKKKRFIKINKRSKHKKKRKKSPSRVYKTTRSKTSALDTPIQ